MKYILTAGALLLGSVLITLFGDLFLGWDPCPICLVQRALYVITALCLFAWAKTQYKIFMICALSFIGSGLALGGWHLFLLKKGTLSCGASFEFLAQKFGMFFAVKDVLTSGCGVNSATFMGVGLPYLSVAIYIVVLILLGMRKNGLP